MGGCGKQVENNRLLSGVCQPLMSLSSHLEEKQHAAGFYCTGTMTGTGAETASTHRGWGEETSLSVWFPSTGQCISHVNAHLTYFYLASLFLPSFLFLYLQQFCLVMLFNLHPLGVHKICFLNYSFTCTAPAGCIWSAGREPWIQWHGGSVLGLQEGCICAEESALDSAEFTGHRRPALPGGTLYVCHKGKAQFHLIHSSLVNSQCIFPLYFGSGVMCHLKTKYKEMSNALKTETVALILSSGLDFLTTRLLNATSQNQSFQIRCANHNSRNFPDPIYTVVQWSKRICCHEDTVEYFGNTLGRRRRWFETHSLWFMS